MYPYSVFDDVQKSWPITSDKDTKIGMAYPFRISKLHKFLVIGDFTFPWDMLRYDSCWPARTHEATALGQNSSRYGDHDYGLRLSLIHI